MLTLLSAVPVLASSGEGMADEVLDLTTTSFGYAALIIFVLAYTIVILEDKIHLRKSKPVMMAAGIIWVLLAILYKKMGQPEVVHNAILHNIMEYTELMLFLQ